MNGLFAVAADVHTICARAGWRFCFIGGLAVQRWGEPRQTRAVDLTILTGFGDEEAVIDPLLARFDARIDDAREFAITNRVVLLQSADGVGIDIALGGLPFEERAIDEATDWNVGQGVKLLTCSAEALVVYKAFAGRPQDWIDLEMVIARQGDALRRDQIVSDLEPLLELKQAESDLDRLLGLL